MNAIIIAIEMEIATIEAILISIVFIYLS